MVRGAEQCGKGVQGSKGGVQGGWGGAGYLGPGLRGGRRHRGTHPRGAGLYCPAPLLAPRRPRPYLRAAAAGAARPAPLRPLRSAPPAAAGRRRAGEERGVQEGQGVCSGHRAPSWP